MTVTVAGGQTGMPPMQLEHVPVPPLKLLQFTGEVTSGVKSLLAGVETGMQTTFVGQIS